MAPNENLLADLTPAQRTAVTHRDGPLLVIAGAGSGKTRVITRRVAHLVADGVPARNILAITFTNKAAGEMKGRVEQLVGQSSAPLRGAVRRDLGGVTVSTFHSLCARLLRRFAPALGFERSFAILDESDQRAAVREALAEIAADKKLFPAAQISHLIGRAKDSLETPETLMERAASQLEKVVANAFKVYERLLRERNAFDFGDLIAKTVELLRTDPTARALLQERFRYVLIDEYQDTNQAQYELAKWLAQAHGNIQATGDPDQSIYGWRGADVGNILRFEQDWPDAKVVVLERNYRSSQMICRAANGLIAHNKQRKEKNLETLNDDGDALELHAAGDELDEARWVSRRIEDFIQGGTAPGEIAIFYRANALSRSIEQMLFERRIPYRVVGALSFYERKEVKDVLAWLRVVANPRDETSMIRALQAPARKIGSATIEKLKAFARSNAMPLSGAVECAGEVPGLPPRTVSSLEDVAQILERLRERVAHGADAATLVAAVVEETNYFAYLKDEFPDEEDRRANIDALIDGAAEFDRAAAKAPVARKPRPAPPPRAVKKGRKKQTAQIGLFDSSSSEEETVVDAPAPDEPDVLPEPEAGLAGFLEQVALLAARDEAESDTTEKVSLMTVHTAKGLEFDVVFLLGLEDGLFPNARALEAADGLEEERRLAYVAITRARKRLLLSHAARRSRFGRDDARAPSKFIFEIPDEVYLAGQAPRDVQRHQQNPRWDDDDDVEGDPRSRWGRMPSKARFSSDEGDPELADVENAPRFKAREPRKEVTSPEAQRLLEGLAARAKGATVDEDLKPGDRIRHDHFGVGDVLSVDGRGMGKRARIRFLEFGEKTLALQWARMTKVS